MWYDEAVVYQIYPLGLCGAYSVTEGLGLFLSRDLPQVILWQNGAPYPVRSETPTYPINTPAV